MPNIESLTLINNNIEELTEIDNLSSLKSLKFLTLLRNPVAALKHYRLYTIYRIPSLRVLDFKRIRDKEREEAQKLYKGKKLKKSEVPRTFIPGEQLDKLSLNQAGGDNAQKKTKPERTQPSKEDIDAIRVKLIFFYKLKFNFIIFFY